MTQEEINEGNKIIAEFMGAKPSKVDNDKRYLRFTEPHAGTDTYAFYPWNLFYHTSWDWLMPVVQKINSMTPELKLPRDLQAMKDRTHPFEKYADVLGLPVSSPINEVYKAIVQFIKWHNSQSNP